MRGHSHGASVFRGQALQGMSCCEHWFTGNSGPNAAVRAANLNRRGHMTPVVLANRSGLSALQCRNAPSRSQLISLNPHLDSIRDLPSHDDNTLYVPSHDAFLRDTIDSLNSYYLSQADDSFCP
jgi:hypothetical protein